MPRKSKFQTPPQNPPRAPRGSRDAQWFCQCMNCGARVDPIYEAGENSWCPSCGQSDLVVCEQGRLPDPALYGRWVAAQRAVPPQAHGTGLPSSRLSTIVHGGTKNRTLKTHTGIYSCLTCCVEFDLLGETSLKCDTCGGLLEKGTLENLLDDEPDDPKHEY